MYLQALEINGFKSFAKKTRLVFEPGITAIVGPNGCGKSNVSDAIRWVLGEQRPTALRGGAMTDVIFAGTDEHKPLGMAEVSITFADCEKELGLEYNEVTVTRRVFRTGEGQYFINRTPCRLRDIQRLFMDTGIGTTSYSVMAQGQIDAILSSRPEDRRAIFEEASGITRFRADRREALRKLEATDQNLARLADVIAELRRQIHSLRAQASRARRYKEMQAELRKVDLFLAGIRLAELEARGRSLAQAFEKAKSQGAGLRGRVAEADAALEADLARIGPFGTLNPQPLLGMRGLTLARDPSRFGRTTVNWRLEFAETPVPGVVFGRPEMPFRGGDRLDAVFHFARDNFGAPQFFLRDLRRA